MILSARAESAFLATTFNDKDESVGKRLLVGGGFMLMRTGSDLHSAAQQHTKPSALFPGLILFQRSAVYDSSVSIALVKELLQTTFFDPSQSQPGKTNHFFQLRNARVSDSSGQLFSLSL
jgi:hypothetical protein